MRVGQRPRQHRVGERGQAAAGASGDARGRAPRAAARRAHRPRVDRHGDALRQPAQAEQDQHGRHDLDRELREREIGRREPDEGEAGDEPGAAEQDQRGEPVELRLPGGAERAGRADRPTAARTRVDGGSARGRPSSSRTPVQRPEPRRAPPRTTMPAQLRLQAPRAEQRSQRPRASAATRRPASRSKMRRPSSRRQQRRAVAAPRAQVLAQQPGRAATPPASATALISSGSVEAVPDRQAVLRAVAAPSTERAATSRNGPDRQRRARCRPPGRRAPAARSGTRIQRGGSCGVRGRSAGGGPKNTPWMKRSE